MIDQNEGEIKLVDFGFAKDLSHNRRQGDRDRTFTKCGTPGYTAPEVLLQEEISSMFNIRAENNAISPQKQKKQISSKGGRDLITFDLVGFGSTKSIKKTVNTNKNTKQTRAYDSQNSSGYGYPADVWSWGVLVCELIGGFNPFQGQSVLETFENISRIEVNWPKNLDQASSQMLQAIF